MRVLLDDQPCISDATSVGEAIANAADSVRERGRVLVEVVVDGARWSEVELSSTASRSAVAGEVTITTADLTDLVRTLLDDASKALVEADGLHRKAAEDLHADRRSQAMIALGEALGIWMSVRNAVASSAEALRLDLDSLEAGGQPVRTRIDELNEQLRALHAGLESDDPVGLADTLLYDLPEVVVGWREALEAIAARIDDDSSDSVGKPPVETMGEA